jgi:hypothetical protein
LRILRIGDDAHLATFRRLYVASDTPISSRSVHSGGAFGRLSSLGVFLLSWLGGALFRLPFLDGVSVKRKASHQSHSLFLNSAFSSCS